MKRKLSFNSVSMTSCAVALALLFSLSGVAQSADDGGGAAARKPATARGANASGRKISDVDPPDYYKNARGGGSKKDPVLAKATSIVKGQPAGIEVGECPPDFRLEPVEMNADFKKWLGDKAPKGFKDKVMLSDLAHKAPIILLFGSYT